MGNIGIPPIEPRPADAGSVAADAADLAKDAATVAEQSGAPAAASPPVSSAAALVTATEKVADKLESSQDKIAATLEDSQRRSEAREERREVREWRSKMFLALLSFCATIAGIWAATESRNTGHTVNSRMDDMILRVEKASRAEGVLEGKESRDK